MLEVRPGLLLGSMGDALAVFSRVPSVVAQYYVTHVLTLCNNPPEWATNTGPEEVVEDEGEPENEDKVEKKDSTKDVFCEAEKEEENEENNEENNKLEADATGGNKEKKKKKHRRRRKKIVDLPKWRKFIEVADMPESDLLHHFENCCQFIRNGREMGTVLVHCEYGISRSVTVVLAYLMWSERRSLKVLYQEMKEKRPEIRPNPGFMNQLRLWEDMDCQLKLDNKKYRAYCLQCKAREIKATGLVEEVKMAPDPSSSAVNAGLYFRCRKCRQLLFTDQDVLQHDLGEGRRSFDRRGGKRGTQHHTKSSRSVNEGVQEETGEMALRPTEMNDNVDKSCDENLSSIKCEVSEETGSESEKEKKTTKKEDENSVDSVILGGNPNSPTVCLLSDHTPLVTMETEASAMRREIGSIRARQAALSLSPSCTSYFIEPVAWMGESLLGHLEGKILCPKCNSRLGSFNWGGQQCSCGRWLTPAFQIHKSRVDEIRTLSKRKTSSPSSSTTLNHS